MLIKQFKYLNNLTTKYNYQSHYFKHIYFTENFKFITKYAFETNRLYQAQ